MDETAVMVEERPVSGITNKLIAVMNDVSHIAKNGTNDFHKYKYATSADVLEKINSAFVRYGICPVAKAKLISLETVTNAKGNQERLATVQMFIRLVDVESGEYVDIAGLGNGQDSGDKAVMKAQTAAIKYAFMMNFCISTGDDPEADANTDRFMEAPSSPTPNYAVNTGNATVETAQQPAPRIIHSTRGKSSICSDCGAGITEKVANYSISRFGYNLCMNCQKNHQSA